MNNQNRLEQLSLFIKERKQVSMQELTDAFGISLSTLRRDIRKLIDRGIVRKTYGGVESCSQRALTPLSDRLDLNSDGKFRIAREAALSITDGDVIFLDSGSTVGAMAQFLGRLDKLTVISNNMLVIKTLVMKKIITEPKVQLITLSGIYNPQTFSFVGDEVGSMLQRYNVSKAFMGTTGLSLTSGITHSTQLESAIKRQAVAQAQKVYLLADHLKFDTFAPYTYCSMQDIDELYTDEALTEDYRSLCAEAETAVHIASE